MFWPFLAATAVGIGLVRLGALTVWVSVLKSMLSLLLTVVLAVGAVITWRRYRSP